MEIIFIFYLFWYALVEIDLSIELHKENKEEVFC